MNRIILIGNGFDLAHGMETSYNNFLDDFWTRTIEKVEKNSSKLGVAFQDKFIQVNGTKLIGHSYSYDLSRKGFHLFKHYISVYNYEYKFKNKFLKLISSKDQLNNWVDVENEYYQELLRIIKEEHAHVRLINELNLEFRNIQHLLEKYLEEERQKFRKKFDNKELTSSINLSIYSPFKFSDFTEESLNKRVESEFHHYNADAGRLYRNDLPEKKLKTVKELEVLSSMVDIKKSIRNILIGSNGPEYFDLTPENLLFLNFNYTDTDTLYHTSTDIETDSENTLEIKTEVIRIHGSLNEGSNPIIFGYGDEIDESYKEIEKLNDNRLLENVKSIRYLETANYKNLLEYLNAEEFQVFIFGHSCGISDRTLLNTIFEHKNCVSIKPFYHQKDDKNDNYSDLVRNISRNFNDNVLMRSKVVNKTYCEPLTSPQKEIDEHDLNSPSLS